MDSTRTNQPAPPSRASTLWVVLRFLGLRALLIAITIYVGIFFTIVLVNRPVVLGFTTKPPQFETNLRKQAKQAVDAYYYEHLPEFETLTPAEIDARLAEIRLQVDDEMGLNLPYLPRHLKWTLNALRFGTGNLRQLALAPLPMLNLGWRNYLTTNDIILKHLPNTLLLAGLANLIIFLAGIPLALWLSGKYGSRADRFFTLLAPLFSIPSWVIGIFLIAIFAVWLRVLPFGGMLDTLPPGQPIGYAWVVAKHLVLPVLAVVLSLIFQLIYAWRTYFLIFSEEDYVDLGKAVGLPARRLAQQYVFRPAFTYILTSFSMVLLAFWQMTMALEVIFNWPGIGWLFVKVGLPNFWGESMYPGEMIVAVSLIVLFAYVLGLVVFILDLLYVLVDPRVRASGSEPTLDEKQGFRLSTLWHRSRVHFARRVFAPTVEEIPVTIKPVGISRLPFLKTLQAAWSQVIRFPSAIFGLVIILVLLAGSLYALIALPYGKIGAGWGGSTMTGQPSVPKLARPAWVNIFRTKDYLSTLILDSRNGEAQRVETTRADGSREIDLTFEFDYNYADFPSETVLYLDGNYTVKRSFAAITWITPDGREIKLKNTAVSTGTTYDLAENILVQRLVNSNPHLAAWFRFGQIDPTPAHYILFADPGADTPTLVPGRYTVRVEGLTFEPGNDISARLVLLGSVYGLAGTDNLRRELSIPLLWGMPIALGFGLLGALLTTLLSLLISAAGVWYGGWLDALIQRLTDINLVLPVLAISVLAYAYLNVDLWVIMVIVVLLNVLGSPTKNFRSAFLSIRSSPYIEVAQSYGASSSRIILKYMVPRILPTVIPQLIVLIPSFVFLEVTLGLFNINTGYPTWGTLIYQGLTQGALYHHQYRIIQPLGLVLLTGMAFSLFGFSLERILNPRLDKG